ncbi:MAG TPA: hypothetical protein VL860_05475 [Planctomycetota bacterium]|nr:hypothetical protein [Planctomycetota bacterium]
MASSPAQSGKPASSGAGSAARPVVISVRKGQHEYHFQADSELNALQALLQTADSGIYNLTRHDVVPYIDYLGYTLAQIENAPALRRVTTLPPQAA